MQSFPNAHCAIRLKKRQEGRENQWNPLGDVLGYFNQDGMEKID